MRRARRKAASAVRRVARALNMVATEPGRRRASARRAVRLRMISAWTSEGRARKVSSSLFVFIGVVLSCIIGLRFQALFVSSTIVCFCFANPTVNASFLVCFDLNLSPVGTIGYSQFEQFEF